MATTPEDNKHTPEFYWFPNHGDDEGNGEYTICYGDPTDDLDIVIVGAEDNEEDATEACKRLNSITSCLLAERDQIREERDEAILEGKRLSGIAISLTLDLAAARKEIDRLKLENAHEHADYLKLREQQEQLVKCLETIKLDLEPGPTANLIKSQINAALSTLQTDK